MTQGPGFLAGVLRGAVLSLAVLAALSVMLPGPARQEMPPQDRLEPPPGSEFSRAPVETPARLPEAERLPDPAATVAPPAGAAPAARESGAGADTEPVARPQVADVPAAPPAAPVAEPAPPPPAAESAAGSQPLPGPPGSDVPRPSRLPQVEAPAAAGGALAPETVTAPEPAAPAPARLPQVAPPPPATGDAAPQQAPAPAGAEAPPAAQGDAASAAGSTPPGPAESAPAPSSRLPQIEPPAGPRLPGVAPEGGAPALPGGGGAQPAPGGSDEPAAAPATGDGAETPRLGALARNAVPFEVGETPLLAVVLIDAGPAGADIALLGSIPFPVSFAVDPSAPDAAERALALRAAGFEVLALLPEGAAGLPENATPADVEAALAAHVATLPMAVAMLAPDTAAPLVAPGPLARQMLAHLARSGHGLVLAQSGLNSLAQAAARASVPALTLFRNLDATREPAPAIRRYLDRAAFEARAQGRVAMLGHTYPETVRALLEWGSGPEARSVALAPVSALLRTAR